MPQTEWNGFRRIDFIFQGREAILVFPSSQNRTAQWLLKTEYFDAFPNCEIELVKRGFHLAYLKNINRWGTDADQDAKRDFAQHLAAEYGLADRCVPVGMSCGGLHAVNLASRHPEIVAALYLDAPVLNLLSCPGGMGCADYSESMWQELVDAYGFTRSELISYRQHPIDRLDILLENKIPVILVYGDSDPVVPYCENGAVLERYYRENGGIIQVIGKPGCGHHPHGLADPAPIVDFILAHA